MARVYTKIGDIFSVSINNYERKYFQYIANDLTQLNSDVIRAFKKPYLKNDTPQLAEIVNDEVDFYAHCIVNLGAKLEYWQKVGNVKEVGALINILFKGTSDYGHKMGEDPIKVSNNWYVWNINDQGFTKVGKLKGKNEKAEIGLVLNPHDIITRLSTGKYDFTYPEF